jgi:NAD-dependent deacetylase
MNIRSVVVLTGAGISAESGLKTFRDHDGLWEGHRVEDVATPEAFQRNPDLVYDFYNQRRSQLISGTVHPNAAHCALGDFEKRFAGEFLLITQNVDDLHEQGGSKRIVHMHGELKKMRCQRSGKVYECEEDIHAGLICECCSVPGTLRPHIVWFGETPLSMDIIESSVARCDLFISIGTSGAVYPAAGLRQIADAYGAHTVELNKEPSAGADYFDECHYGPASQVVPDFFNSLLAGFSTETGR